MKEVNVSVKILLQVEATATDNPIGMVFTLYSLCNWTELVIRVHHPPETVVPKNARSTLLTFLKQHDHIINPENWEYTRDDSEMIKRNDTSLSLENKRQYSYFVWRIKESVLRTL